MTIDTSTSRTKILDRLSAIQSQQGQLIDKALLDESRPKALYAKTALELEEHFTRILEAHSGKVFSLDNMDNLPKAVASHLENLSLTPVVYAGSNYLMFHSSTAGTKSLETMGTMYSAQFENAPATKVVDLTTGTVVLE